MNVSHRAGGLDWLEVWRRMYHQERDQAERVTRDDFLVGADYWAAQADRFAAAARRAPQPDAFLRYLLPQLRAEDTVLDIGAGSGRYLPLLSRACAHVIALEPSPSMRRNMEQRIADENLTNVSVVSGAWPDAEVPVCDVVFSAHVVYAVPEIGPFLSRMNASARRFCALFLAVRHPASFIGPLWSRFHYEERDYLPGALECLCALHQLGMPARLNLVQTGSRIAYTGLDEALADVRFRLRFAPEPQRDQQIMAMIRESFLPADDGSLVPPGQSQSAAIIEWPVAETSATL